MKEARAPVGRCVSHWLNSPSNSWPAKLVALLEINRIRQLTSILAMDAARKSNILFVIIEGCWELFETVESKWCKNKRPSLSLIDSTEFALTLGAEMTIGVNQLPQMF